MIEGIFACFLFVNSVFHFEQNNEISEWHDIHSLILSLAHFITHFSENVALCCQFLECILYALSLFLSGMDIYILSSRLNPLMHKVVKMVTWNNGVRRHTGLTHGFYF